MPCLIIVYHFSWIKNFQVIFVKNIKQHLTQLHFNQISIQTHIFLALSLIFSLCFKILEIKNVFQSTIELLKCASISQHNESIHLWLHISITILKKKIIIKTTYWINLMQMVHSSAKTKKYTRQTRTWQLSFPTF
jgi:hypothetical protein